MHNLPTTGVIGAQPQRAKRKNDLPNRQTEEIKKLSAEYLIQRNDQMKAKNQTAQMLLAKARGELILKDLVTKQASYLLVSLRQKILSMPLTYSQRLLNISDARVMNGKLKEVAISLLNELMDLPQKVVEPNWLETLEKDEGK